MRFSATQPFGRDGSLKDVEPGTSTDNADFRLWDTRGYGAFMGQD
jgi:hypothetical protein